MVSVQFSLIIYYSTRVLYGYIVWPAGLSGAGVVSPGGAGAAPRAAPCHPGGRRAAGPHIYTGSKKEYRARRLGTKVARHSTKNSYI